MCPLLLCDFCSPNTLSTSVVRALSGGVFPLLCWVPHIYLPPSRFANVWSWENARPFKLPPLLFVWDQNFPPNTLAEKLFWFLFLMDVGVFASLLTGASRVFTLSVLRTSGRCALWPVYSRLRGPPGVTQQCSSTRRRPVGSHHMGSCPCGNLWQVGSEIFTSGNKEWVGKFHFKPNSLYLLALPHLKGEPVGGLLRPPARSSLRFPGLCLPTTCGIKFKTEGLPAKTLWIWKSIKSQSSCTYCLMQAITVADVGLVWSLSEHLSICLGSWLVAQVKESTCNAGDVGSIPGSGRSPWRRKWQATPAFLLGKNPMNRGAWWATVGYSP